VLAEQILDPVAKSPTAAHTDKQGAEEVQYISHWCLLDGATPQVVSSWMRAVEMQLAKEGGAAPFGEDVRGRGRRWVRHDVGIVKMEHAVR
jgi:hypothetical protein